MIQEAAAEHPEMPLTGLCEMFSVSRSWYYEKLSPEVAVDKDLDLRDAIEQIVLEFPGYGYRRVSAELRRRGFSANHKRVPRIMREESLLCQLRRRFVPTTDSGHAFGIYPNLIKDVELDGVNQAWISDITYVRLPATFCYLAAILDAYSRRCVGWCLSRKIDTSLTLGALEMALANRQFEPGLIHHSDRGVQGGFNRSKQHPQFWRCWYEQAEGLEFDDDGPGTDAFAGTPGREPRCSEVVLGQGRRGPPQRGRRGRLWCVAGCRHAVVPREWWYATNQSHSIWAVLIVR
jgi:hypothetical protein